MYLGRSRVRNMRVTADYIDQLAEKMLAREEANEAKRVEELEERSRRERKRHASMPDTLDTHMVRFPELVGIGGPSQDTSMLGTVSKVISYSGCQPSNDAYTFDV